MIEKRQPFAVYQARKNTITVEDFRRMLFKRAKMQALAGVLAAVNSDSGEEDCDNMPTALYGHPVDTRIPDAVSGQCEAASDADMQQIRQGQEDSHPRADTRRANLVQSRKEALSQSRLEGWQSQDAQRQQDHATAAEQQAAEQARLLAAAAEKRAEVQRLEADAEGRNRQQAQLKAQQQELFAFKQALVEQMQQTQVTGGSNQAVRNSTHGDTPTAFAAAYDDCRAPASPAVPQMQQQQLQQQVSKATAMDVSANQA